MGIRANSANVFRGGRTRATCNAADRDAPDRNAAGAIAYFAGYTSRCPGADAAVEKTCQS